MSVTTVNGNGTATTDAQGTVPTATATMVPPLRPSQRETIDYGAALPVTAFAVDRDAPHFLPLRDKEGKIVTFPDGRKQLSSDRATDAQMSQEMLRALRTVRGSEADTDGNHILSSGGIFNLSIKCTDGTIIAADVRLVGITSNKREKAENATIFFAVRTAQGYVRDSLRIRKIHAISGNR
jgi:hypothetical protein